MTLFDMTRIAAVAAVLACGAARAEPAAAPALSVTFTGIEAKQGGIMVALFDEGGWATGKPLRAVMVDAAGTARADFAGLPAGRYGVKAFHDLNGNGTMDTNPFGVPTEPFAFSNDAKGAMGPASWEAAAFDVPAGGAAQTITIR